MTIYKRMIVLDILKKFLNDESILDSLRWFFAPFLISFSIAIVAFAFSFSTFQGIKATDWIMALCTIGVLIGTWKAANYAKKAAHQAQIQNNNAIISKIDDLYGELGRDLRYIRNCLINTCYLCEEILNKRLDFNLDNVERINKYINEVLDTDRINNIFRHSLFVSNVIGFSDLNRINDFIFSIRESTNCFPYIDESTLEKLKNSSDNYWALINELLQQIEKKYQELLNGSS
ncbi:hypothetical protein [Rodentibacter haemolyticus]|uniref:Uncharacterized protein n=1 Tax=Rodentibacter haemolyticus TaxID=2778911 RepID=A0ABX6V134_9PAST|nr:hypothetical protein [Rodentibacter haemolyticus]QPB43036.1 hypothetical protein IHV77_02660 [Rodentibacter haemolyticus]